MNNLKKKIIALVALACVALSAFAGCADKNTDDSGKKSKKDESSQSSEEPMTALPFHWGGADDNDITIDGVDINVDDPVKADHVAPTKASEETTSSSDSSETDASNADTKSTATTAYIAGEPITSIVTVTDANGEAVTEAGGAVVTEVKTITNATPEPTTADNANNSGNTENTDNNATVADTTGTTEYISNTKGMYAMWIDISKNKNFVFNDSMIKIIFKVKDNAPDGVYDISISPDISDIAGVEVIADTIVNGSVKVGDGSADAIDPSTMDGFAIYGDHVSAKQGDTVEVSLNMKDNPGMAAFCIWYYYDSNALEIVDCYPDGEFAKISNGSTQTGE
ncbi:MAG: hypothetical protein K2K02_07425 [Ruminococcus sp.]|nr:hypothetical protein [Ruminococcus sp.]MDE6678856.1 hypothetical protein [Ruminococcus sp.]